MQSGNKSNESLRGQTVVEILYAEIRKKSLFMLVYTIEIRLIKSVHIRVLRNQQQKSHILHTLEVCIGPLVKVFSQNKRGEGSCLARGHKTVGPGRSGTRGTTIFSPSFFQSSLLLDLYMM